VLFRGLVIFMKKYFTLLTNFPNKLWSTFFPAADLPEYGVTEIPDGMFLSPFTYDEFTQRDYEGYLARVFLRRVIKLMLRKNKGKWAALLDNENPYGIILTVTVLLGIAVITLVGVPWAVSKYYPVYLGLDLQIQLVIGTLGTLSSALIFTPIKSFVRILINNLVPKKSKKVLRMEYAEANLDALVPETGDLPPQFVEVLRAETPYYGSGDKSNQSTEEMENRKKTAKDLASKRRFPHHLEFLFHPNFRQPESYAGYPLLDGGRKTVQTEPDNRHWAWTMVGIWSLLPPTPESGSNWGTSEEDADRIAKYVQFAKNSLTKNVFETILAYKFDDKTLPPARKKNLQTKFASSELAPSICFDSTKVDVFLEQMLASEGTNVAKILEVMAEDMLSKS